MLFSTQPYEYMIFQFLQVNGTVIPPVSCHDWNQRQIHQPSAEVFYRILTGVQQELKSNSYNVILKTKPGGVYPI